jgi:hypothetical protein
MGGVKSLREEKRGSIQKEEREKDLRNGFSAGVGTQRVLSHQQ